MRSILLVTLLAPESLDSRKMSSGSQSGVDWGGSKQAAGNERGSRDTVQRLFSKEIQPERTGNCCISPQYWAFTLKDYKRCFNSHHQVLIFSLLYSTLALQNAGLGRLISIGKTTLKHCIEQDIRGTRVCTYFYEGPESKYFSHMISVVTARVCHFSALNQSWLCCAQSCPTLCDPMGCGPPGSSVHGDSPGKNTDAMPSSRGSSQPRDRN